MTLQDLLIRHEGLRLKPYRCTDGKLTIGVGRNLDDAGISDAEAMMLLDNDIEKCIQQAKSNLPWVEGLDNVRKAVVISLIFNLGIEGFVKFKSTIMSIKAGKYDEAADNMMQSLWAKQVGKRAEELSHMMRTGHNL